MAIVATPGAPNANSYVTLEDADAYFAARLHADAWSAASEPNKEAALLWATRVLEAKIAAYWDKKELPGDATIRVLTTLKDDPSCFVVWNGRPATAEQALAWPRSGMASKNGLPLAEDVIPSQLKNAQCELALLLMQSDRTAENAAAVQGLAGLKAGPVELSWRDGAPNPRLIPDAVMQLLAPSWWFAFELKYQTRATLQVL